MLTVYQHRVLIIRKLNKTPQNSLICERERASWIFFEYRAHFSVSIR